jgi:gluconokinase
VQLQGAGLRRFPELGQTQWFPAVGDGAASNLGSDAVTDGVAALNMGTSGALRLISSGAPPPTPLGLFCYRVDDHRWLVGGAISNAGNLRAWALRELRLPDDPVAIDRALAARPGPTHGLTVLPFWTAERSPTWPEDIAGTISGLTQATTALDLLQALTESSYHRLAQIADLLEPIPKKKSLEIVVSGGIQKSIVALQRLTDVLGRPTRISHEAEASLRGAAVYAWQRLGHTVPAMPKGKVLRPHPKLAKAYAEARLRQVDLERRFATGNTKT